MIESIYVFGDELLELLGLILLSVSLSVDAFGIGTSCAVRGIKTPWRSRVIICIVSMAVTGLAVSFGKGASSLMPPWLAKVIGCAMLCVLGLYIIVGALTTNKKRKAGKKKKSITLALKPLGITVNIIKDPISCDMDSSKSIDSFEACYMGVALSVDSFAAGVSTGITGMSSIAVVAMCGGCQLLFLCMGLFLGKRLRLVKNINDKVFTVISGVLLIVLSIIRVLL